MNATCRWCALTIFTTNGSWHDLNTILPECCSVAEDGKHAPEPVRCEVKITFELDGVTSEHVREHAEQFQGALDSLAEIMLVQAEDGLYEQGCEDTWDEKQSNEHIAHIRGATHTTGFVLP